MNPGGKNRSSVQSTNQAGTEGQASREVWDEALAGLLRRIRGHAKTAIVSNAWPATRVRMARAGRLDIADEIVLSCEAGYAKLDPRIYQAALQRLAASPGDALFIDDTPGHVAAAKSLGMSSVRWATTPSSRQLRIFTRLGACKANVASTMRLAVSSAPQCRRIASTDDFDIGCIVHMNNVSCNVPTVR
jgi:FMN phosphatase YigB (HAD superfamily)